MQREQQPAAAERNPDPDGERGEACYLHDCHEHAVLVRCADGVDLLRCARCGRQWSVPCDARGTSARP